MIEPYRTREWPGFTVRWIRVPCIDESGLCVVPEHHLAFVGIDFDGMDRWVIVSELVDMAEEDAEDTIDSVYADSLGGWRLLCAAFGLAWEEVDARQAERQGRVCYSLPVPAMEELGAQGVEGMLALRRLVGRNIGAMAPLLTQLGRYRANVGGTKEENYGAW